MIVYVELLDEGTAVWYPVEAVSLGADVYEITGDNPNPEDLHWKFKKGEKVRCKPMQLADGEYLVAYEFLKQPS